MMRQKLPLLIIIALTFLSIKAQADIVRLGLDSISLKHIENKRIGLYTNQTGVDQRLQSTLEKLANSKGIELVKVFTPEHGLKGNTYAKTKITEQSSHLPIKMVSLFGQTDKPTEAMMMGIDMLIVDIQAIGVRPYTYTTHLFQLIEIAAKLAIDVVVLDRPNPISGMLVDGPMNAKPFLSTFGYIEIPYIHGMTIGELAQYFNGEYNVGAKLTVVPMTGWRRDMNYGLTGLQWMPSSPNIPESSTPIFAASTGALGELGLINIGVGYTLPFKIVGAPWINAEQFSSVLNRLELSGVFFQPFYYKPFYGLFKGEECQGVLIMITNKKQYQPFSVQYALLDTLKKLYPQAVHDRLRQLSEESELQFNRVIGHDALLHQLKMVKPTNLLTFIGKDQKMREAFLVKRSKYLIESYAVAGARK